MKRILPVSAERAYELLSDLPGHRRWIPLTRVDAPSRLHVGDVITARTAGILLDRMQVTAIHPPHRLAFTKIGPVLLGSAGITITPLSATRCRVDWWERVHLAGPLPQHFTRALLRPVLEAMTRLALRRLARWVHRQ